MGETGGSSKDTTAVRAASRFAAARSHSQGARPRQGRQRSGSLALTALAVIAALVGMLWLMISLG